MKKLKEHWVVVVSIVLLLVAGLVYAATETISEGTGGGRARYLALRKRTITFTETELNSSPDTGSVSSVHGIVLRVSLVTSSDSTDADWDFLLRDENDITILAVTALNSGSAENFSYAVYEDGSDANSFRGVPIAGVVDAVVTDATDVNGLAVNIYYLEMWK